MSGDIDLTQNRYDIPYRHSIYKTVLLRLSMKTAGCREYPDNVMMLSIKLQMKHWRNVHLYGAMLKAKRNRYKGNGQKAGIGPGY